MGAGLWAQEAPPRNIILAELTKLDLTLMQSRFFNDEARPGMN